MNELRVPPDLASRVVRLNTVMIASFGLILLLPLTPLVLMPLAFSVDSRWLLVIVAAYLAVYLVMVLGTRWLARRFVRRSTVRFGDGSYRIGRLFGSEQVYRADQLALGVYAERLRLGGAPAVHHLAVAGRRAPAFHLVGHMFAPGQLDELAADLWRNGVLVERVTQPITGAVLRQRDPRLIRWWRAHPVLFGLLAAAVVVPVLLLLFVVLVFVALFS